MISSSEFVRALLAMSAPADPNASPWLSLLPFVVILGIFYVMVLLPMKRRQQKVADFQRGLKINDRVITTGGIYGTITRLSDQQIQIQIAPQVRIDVARASIGGLQGQDPVVPDPGAA
ncbi:MAG: preprotein translocase subunit YajC [Luteitalea sp.]|nr:preprotein translocase subunit YajC [Acidobacteriota bacterium]